MVQKFVKGYSTLFNQTDEEEDEEGEEYRGEEEDDGGNSEFGKKWRWIRTVDRVSETCRCSWDEVFNMGVYEFFNILCYSIDKKNEEERQLKQWKKQ